MFSIREKIWNILEAFFKAEDIMQALDPLIKFSKIMGVFPFDMYIEPGNSKMKIAPIYLIWSVLIQTVYITSVVIVTKNNETLTSMFNFSFFYQIGDYLRIHLSFFMILIMVLTGFFNIKRFPLILERLYINENQLITLGIYKNYSKYKIIQAIALTLCLIFLIINIFLNLYLIRKLNINPSVYFFIAMFAPGVYSLIVVMFFNTIVVVGGDTIQKLSEDLEKINERRLIKNSPNFNRIKSVYVGKTSEDSDLLVKISKMWDIYENICDLYELGEKGINMNVLMMIGCSFISLVFNEFQALLVVVEFRKSEKNFFFLLFCLHQVVSHSIILLVLISMNNRTKNMVINFMR